MKKISIVLLAVLLILSFTSCEKDKSEEMISTYEKFGAGFRIGDNIYRAKYKTGAIETSDYRGSSKYFVEEILIDLFNYDSTFEITDVTEAKGTIKNIEGYTDEYHLTYENCEVSYTYTYGTSTGSGKLTFSGSYSYDKKDDVETYVYDFILNGESYKTEYTMKDYEFTLAKINGEDVNLSLLNAREKF